MFLHREENRKHNPPPVAKVRITSVFCFGSLSNEDYFSFKIFFWVIYLSHFDFFIFLFFGKQKLLPLKQNNNKNQKNQKKKKKNQRAPSPKGIEFPCAGLCRASVNFFLSVIIRFNVGEWM